MFRNLLLVTVVSVALEDGDSGYVHECFWVPPFTQQVRYQFNHTDYYGVTEHIASLEAIFLFLRRQNYGFRHQFETMFSETQLQMNFRN